ncbi:hypothetical protein BDW68DRAFT_156771 [Aspergillus falconensis]
MTCQKRQFKSTCPGEYTPTGPKGHYDQTFEFDLPGSHLYSCRHYNAIAKFEAALVYYSCALTKPIKPGRGWKRYQRSAALSSRPRAPDPSGAQRSLKKLRYASRRQKSYPGFFCFCMLRRFVLKVSIARCFRHHPRRRQRGSPILPDLWLVHSFSCRQ